MISDEECNYIFDELAHILHTQQRDDLVKVVQEQIERLDAVPADKWNEVEEHFRPQALLSSPKQEKFGMFQSPLPTFGYQLAEFTEKEPSSVEEIDRGVLSQYIYPAHERLMLLIRAIEAAYPMPIIIGSASLKLLDQSEIRFESVSRMEESFTLSQREIQMQEQNAYQLHQILEQLRQYIQRGEKIA